MDLGGRTVLLVGLYWDDNSNSRGHFNAMLESQGGSRDNELWEMPYISISSLSSDRTCKSGNLIISAYGDSKIST